MAAKTEGGNLGRPDATHAVVMGGLTRGDVAQLVRGLRQDFDARAGTRHREIGFDQRRYPVVVGLQEMTQAHVDGIAALFGTTATPDQVRGRREQLITMPGSGDTIKFRSRGNEGERTEALNIATVVVDARPVGEDTKKIYPIDAVDARGKRDIVVVLGPEAVSFVQDAHHPRLSSDDPRFYIITTITPDGYEAALGYDYQLLQNPLHRLNLAKAIASSNPDLT